MKILLDTNVVLDLLMKREPFHADAAKIFSKIERGVVHAYVCTTTITTIHYLLSKQLSSQQSKRGITLLLKLLDVAPVDKDVLLMAEDAGFKNYEDGVIYASAKKVRAEAIVTRNEKDFTLSEIAVYSPAVFMGL